MFALAGFALPALAQAKPDAGALAAAHTLSGTDEILAMENVYIRTVKSGSTADMYKILSPDFKEVDRKIWSHDQALNFGVVLRQIGCGLSSFKIEDPKVTFLSPDIATIVYHATETISCRSRSRSIDGDVTAVWVRQDGHWRMQLRTETYQPFS